MPITNDVIPTAFEAQQSRMIEEQLAFFERELEEEESRERDNTEKSIQALQEERAQIITERKQKMQQKVSQLSGNKEEQQKLLQSYSEDTHRLVNKIDAERLRIEADLQDRIRKRKQAKRKAKEDEIREEFLQKQKEMEEMERLERQRLAEEEKQKLEALQESLQESFAAGPTPQDEKGEEGVEVISAEGGDDLRALLRFALPLSEQQLTALLLSTPLYQKLEQIKSLLQSQTLMQQTTQPKPTSSEVYIDPKDASWVNDEKFHPTDIGTIPVRAFVVYRFGCCIINSLVAHCNHTPVSLLLADAIPPNQHFTRNAFRNSFAYDANNRILYIRLERLDDVGEFVLVLVHTLSHIHVGSFSNDWDPTFVKEFYHSLSICCSELFFSRYRHSSRLAAACIEESGKVGTEIDSYNFLQAAFGKTQSVIEKENLTDNLLDTRIMMDTDHQGSEFSHEKIMAKLERYSEFRIGSKLRVYLDNAEADVKQQVREGGKLPAVKPIVHTHLPSHTSDLGTQKPPNVHPQKASGHLLLPTPSPKRKKEASRSLTSHAATKLAAGKRIPLTEHVDQYKQFLGVQIHDLQERIDNLNEEYAQLVCERVEMANKVQTLEKDLLAQTENLKTLEEGSSEFESQKQMMKDTTTRLSAAKANCTTSELRVSACSKRLGGFKTQLEQKQQALKEHSTRQFK